jgi:hypothetical protein
MLVLPTGGMGIGVEAEGSNFPFVAPSSDIQGLLADLWVTTDIPFAPPLTVTRLAGFQEAFDGLPSAAGITITDAQSATVFDSTGATYWWKDWGARLRIHEWLFAGSVCRVVQHRAVPAVRAPWPEEIVPASGVLDERTSELMSQRLLVLSEASSGAAVTGEITLAAGYNIVISEAPYAEPLRNTTMLTFSAIPGNGLGRAPGCLAPSSAIRAINGVKPDAQGNFALAAGQCYFVRQPVNVVGAQGVPIAATLDLGNDCGPCCECDDFVNVQQAILNIETQVRGTGALAEATRDEMNTGIERWNQQKECRESHAVSTTAGTTARLYADINILIGNPTNQCMTELMVSFTVVTQPAGHWSVVPGTTYISEANSAAMIPYQLVGPTPSGAAAAHLDAINPGSSGRVRTRLVWDYPMPPGTMLTVTVKVDGRSAGNLFPQYAAYTTIMT